MFCAAHHGQVMRRRARPAGDDRVLIFARDPKVHRWIEHELFAERVTPQPVDSLAEVVVLLTQVPPPWPQFLVLDVEAISPFEVAQLAAIRHANWPGTVLAIGAVSRDMQRRIGIDAIVERSLENEVLRNALKRASAATGWRKTGTML